MEIRPAAPTDAPQICDIWNPIIRDTTITFTTTEKTPADILATLQQCDLNEHPFLVAAEDSETLGFATYT